MYSRRNARKELNRIKQLFTAQTLRQFYLLDTAPQHAYKNPKRKEGTSLDGRRVLSPTTVGVVAPGPDLSRGRRTLSGTPRSDAQVHHTTGAAASPVRASLDRPLATPRAQDQDEDQNDRNSKTKTRTKTTGRQRRGPRRKKTQEGPSCPPFVARGSAPRSAPFLAPPLSLSLHPAPCGGRVSQFWLRAKELFPQNEAPPLHDL